ncbi:nucleoside monophosphate kinase [Candidatus Hikarchaeum yamanae]|uniref:nucleoside monophosphate kinase n=1 Tax=Candidatus Hikarchaeum yamanae TaxID=2675326 RepID=UPI0039E905C8|tara:strand:+ start:36410 stop:37039 length:630 start_codon:yes stop_codon:yes gene_type:complete
MKLPKIVLLGPPGAGKGTQGSLMSEYFGIAHITTGNALRINRDLETELGTPGSFIDRGELVPDSIVNEIVEVEIKKASGFVLDGYPRNRKQAEYLSTISEIDKIIYLDVASEELIKRLSGRRVCSSCGENYHIEFRPSKKNGKCDLCSSELVQRSDDQEETILNRLRVFSEHTEPVLEYYINREGFVRIEGRDNPEDVWESIRKIFEEG